MSEEISDPPELGDRDDSRGKRNGRGRGRGAGQTKARGPKVVKVC